MVVNVFKVLATYEFEGSGEILYRGMASDLLSGFL